MGRLLVVTVHLPFPPRNGVTLPAAALARGLRERGHEVDVAWLQAAEVPAEGVEETRAAVSGLHPVAVRTRSLPARLLGQVVAGRPAFDRWELGDGPDLPHRPDLIWVTPRNCLGAALGLRARAGWEDVPLVAAVNDIWTGVVRQRRERGSGSGFHPGVRRAEARLLARADRVVVQSEGDARVAREELGLSPSRVAVLPNGVPEELFELPLARPRSAVGWVGDAGNPHYRRTTRRLLDDVWPPLRARRPGLTLRLTGPGTAALDVRGREGVELTGFVPELRDVYAPLRLLVAPVFKGHGRINKVAEAMAAGVPVVGDATAFHGLPEFRPGTHGVVAEGWADFPSAVEALLDDEARAAAVGEAARALAARHFHWADRVDRVERWLEGAP